MLLFHWFARLRLAHLAAFGGLREHGCCSFTGSLAFGSLTWPPSAACVSMDAALSLVRSPSARSLGRTPSQFDRRAGGFEHRGLGDEPVGLPVLQDRPALLGVGPVEADDDARADVEAGQ